MTCECWWPDLSPPDSTAWRCQRPRCACFHHSDPADDADSFWEAVERKHGSLREQNEKLRNALGELLAWYSTIQDVMPESMWELAMNAMGAGSPPADRLAANEEQEE